MFPPQPPQPSDFTSVLRSGLPPSELYSGRAPELPPERLVLRSRAHGRALFWPTAVLVVVSAASVFFIGRLPQAWQNQAAAGLAIAIALLFWLLPTLRWLTTRYAITTRRVTTVRGLLARERREASLLRGFDVTLRRRGLQALFRTGDVTIDSGSEHPLVLRDIPDARLVAAALTELGDDAHRRW